VIYQGDISELVTDGNKHVKLMKQVKRSNFVVIYASETDFLIVAPFTFNEFGDEIGDQRKISLGYENVTSIEFFDKIRLMAISGDSTSRVFGLIQLPEIGCEEKLAGDCSLHIEETLSCKENALDDKGFCRCSAGFYLSELNNCIQCHATCAEFHCSGPDEADCIEEPFHPILKNSDSDEVWHVNGICHTPFFFSDTIFMVEGDKVTTYFNEDNTFVKMPVSVSTGNTSLGVDPRDLVVGEKQGSCISLWGFDVFFQSGSRYYFHRYVGRVIETLGQASLPGIYGESGSSVDFDLIIIIEHRSQIVLAGRKAAHLINIDTILFENNKIQELPFLPSSLTSLGGALVAITYQDPTAARQILQIEHMHGYGITLDDDIYTV
jgi:hypothetical protein